MKNIGYYRHPAQGTSALLAEKFIEGARAAGIMPFRIQKSADRGA